MTYEEYLKENGTLTYSNVGVSMLPLLRQGKDLFTVEKNNGRRYKKYDVVLYRRASAKKDGAVQFVLHRIVEVRPDDYVILGDNCINREYGIKDSDILGRMISITRKGGKTITVDSAGFKAFSVVWVALTPVRVFFKKAVIRLKRGVKRVMRSGR